MSGPRTFTPPSGLGSVEHDQLLAMLGTSQHALLHGGNISIETATDILNVVNQTINLFQVLFDRPPRLTVQTVNWQNAKSCCCPHRQCDFGPAFLRNHVRD